MPKPIVGPCGGDNQPACPPQPAAGTTYSADEMNAHGWANYQKGWGDADLARSRPVSVPQIPGTVFDIDKGTTTRPKE